MLELLVARISAQRRAQRDEPFAATQQLDPERKLKQFGIGDHMHRGESEPGKADGRPASSTHAQASRVRAGRQARRAPNFQQPPRRRTAGPVKQPRAMSPMSGARCREYRLWALLLCRSLPARHAFRHGALSVARAFTSRCGAEACEASSSRSRGRPSRFPRHTDRSRRAHRATHRLPGRDRRTLVRTPRPVTAGEGHGH